jgi:hypothetical protein
MIQDRRARWTASGAFATALMALGLSSWAVGCRDRSDAAERESAVLHPAAPAPAPAEIATSGAVVVEPVRATAAAAEPAAPIVKAPAATPQIAAGALAVRRLVVTHAIENREPVSGELRLGDEPIVAFVEVGSSAPVEQTVIVSFERAGSSVGHVKLRVPAQSRRWRTWAQTRRIREPGQWDAVVRSEQGRELFRTPFQVVK